MANKNITGLAGITVPLAGTEVVPIWNGTTTTKVAVADLTAGRSVNLKGGTLTDTFPFWTFSPTGWGASVAYVQAGIDAVGIGAGNHLSVLLPSGKSFAVSIANVSKFEVNATGISTFAINSTLETITGTVANADFLGLTVLNASATGTPGAGCLFQIHNSRDSGYIVARATPSASYESYMEFGVKTSAYVWVPVVKLTANGNVTALSGNFVPATSGKGIDFSAKAGAAGMTSKVLVDYEEGTWTPFWQPQYGVLGAITYENRQGTYTRVGRLVTVQGGFYNSAFAAGTASGILFIGGLPFANGAAAVATGGIGDTRLWAANNPCTIDIGVGASKATIYYKTAANGAVNYILVSDAINGAANNLVYFTIQYITA